MGRETMEEVVERFLLYLAETRRYSEVTVRGYRGDLRQFLAYLAQLRVSRLSKVTQLHLMEYVQTLRGLAPRSVHRRIAPIRSLFAYLEEREELSRNPTRGVHLPKIPRALTKSLSAEEAQRLLAATETPRQRALVVLCLNTGIRRGELCSIRLADLDFGRRQMLVRGKGSRERLVPLNSNAITVLQEYLAGRNGVQCDRLFYGRTGQPLQGKAVNNMIRCLVDRAGLEGVTPHTLRHTFATLLLHAGMDITTIAELLGHAGGETTLRYLHTDTHRKQHAVDVLSSVM